MPINVEECEKAVRRERYDRTMLESGNEIDGYKKGGKYRRDDRCP